MEQQDYLWVIKMDSVVFSGEDGEYIDDNFEMLAIVLHQLHERGTEWEELMNLCLLCSAYCAQEDNMHPDDYMMAVRSIKVTEDGIYGDA